MNRKVKIIFSGVNGTSNNNIHDGKMTVNYFYLFNVDDANTQAITSKTDYAELIERADSFVSPVLMNYQANTKYRIHRDRPYAGLYPTSEEGSEFSFYRREYQKVSKFLGMEMDEHGHAQPLYDNYTIIGEWEPVALHFKNGVFRDFNIKNNMSYQYIMYPVENSNQQAFANGKTGETHIDGDPVKVFWKDWSITELIPVETALDAPIIQKTYKADIDNIWLFKYNLEVGSQTQNITKNEVQTLGQYSRIAYTPYNVISGDVSCMLGSEIIPYGEGYIERMYQSINKPLTVNEKTLMLKKWRALVASKNPKLLKDSKGQSWIVQIFGGSNTPNNGVKNQPDSISFSWKEIGSTDNVVIYGDGDNINRTGGCNSKWIPTEEVKKPWLK